MFVLLLPMNNPAKGLIETFNEVVTIFRDKVGKPFGFDQEPEFFNRVEIG